MINKLLIALTILLFASHAWGADRNIYLDNGGAGAGSEADPYGAFAEINWTTGGDNSIFDWVAAGDDVYINLKKGVAWREQLTVGTSGADGHPITIQAYGTGADPIISGADLVTPGTSWTATSAGNANLASDPEAFGSWTTTRSSISSDVVTPLSPKNTQTVDGLITSEDDNTHTISQNIVTIAETAYTFSVYVKAGGSNFIEIGLGYFDVGWGYLGEGAAYFNLSTGAVGTQWGLTSNAILDVGGGWYRISIIDSTAAGGVNTVLTIFAATADNDNSFVGDTETIYTYLWGAKFEAASSASMYLNTNIWQATDATEPKIVFFDDTKGTDRVAVDSLYAVNQWAWASNVLYTYSASDPDTAYTSPGVEVGTRNQTIVNANNYITFDGLRLTHANGVDEGSLSITGTNTIIQNCTIDYNVHHGVVASNADTGIITACTLSNNGYSGIAPMVDSTSWDIDGNTFSGNDYYDISAGYKGVEAYAAQDLTIQNNNSSNSGSYAYFIAYVNNVTVQDNLIDGVGKQRILSNGIGVLDCSGTIIIRYNSITDVDNYGDGDVSDSCAIIADTDSDGTQIYCNIMWDIDGSGITIWEADSVKVYNNTIYDVGNNAFLNAMSRAAIRVSGTGSGNSVIKNNIVSDGYTNIYLDSNGITGATIDYNIYDDDTGTKFHWNVTDYNFADWKTNSGQDANSPTPTDPLFTDAAGDDFTLKQKSPCINAGVSLGTTYIMGLDPESSWPNNVYTISQKDDWEIGAYVFTGTIFGRMEDPDIDRPVMHEPEMDGP